MKMMQSKGSRRDLLDLLSNDVQFKTHLRSIEEATEARKKATQDYNKAKAEATKEIELLDCKKNKLLEKDKELTLKEERLNTIQNDLKLLELRLNKEKNDIANNRRSLEQEIINLDKYKIDTIKDLKQKQVQLESERSKFELKKQETDKKLAEIETKHYELLSREASVNRREAFLIGIINQLKT